MITLTTEQAQQIEEALVEYRDTQMIKAPRKALSIIRAARAQDLLTIEAAEKMGATGAEPTETERQLFEAWMKGHCWAVCGKWDGKQYVGTDAYDDLHPYVMHTRGLWAAWRDRAALAAPQPVSQEQEPVVDVFKFLLGEGELEGCSFGEKPSNARGNYWWRIHLRRALAEQAEQEPFVWACTECGTELEDDDTRKYCNSCGYNKFYKSPRILRQEPVSQEPVAYLCDGARYKIMGEDRSGYGRILGLPESLAGQWVALVDATDGKHLRAAPVRTKDLTDEEQLELARSSVGKSRHWLVAAVIAAYKEKNK